MSAAPPRPTARCLILCERVVPDAENPKRLSLLRVISTARPAAGDDYPLVQAELSVFAQLTECRGAGRIRIEVRNADTEAVTYRSPEQRFTVPNDPLKIHGVTFRIRNLVFPEPGLYWVQLWYDDDVLTHTSITFRPNSPPAPRGAD